jgi:hypothetical protein
MSATKLFRDPYVHPRFGECHSRSPKSMPRMFDPLARYNSEVSRGLVHTDEYRAQMVSLQALFDEWAEEAR